MGVKHPREEFRSVLEAQGTCSNRVIIYSNHHCMSLVIYIHLSHQHDLYSRNHGDSIVCRFDTRVCGKPWFQSLACNFLLTLPISSLLTAKCCSKYDSMTFVWPPHIPAFIEWSRYVFACAFLIHIMFWMFDFAICDIFCEILKNWTFDTIESFSCKLCTPGQAYQRRIWAMGELVYNW